jgi:hypothetical protein
MSIRVYCRKLYFCENANLLVRARQKTTRIKKILLPLGNNVALKHYSFFGGGLLMSNTVVIVTAILSALCLFFPVTGPENVFAMTLPDTGQTLCYDSSGNTISCAGTGQDGAYTKLRSYTDNGATVTDNVTGLEWQKCSAGQSGSDCSINYWATSYNWYQASGTYNASYNSGGYSVCTALYGSDWRLPTEKELISIVNYGIPFPSPTISATYFPYTVSSGYWSYTTIATEPAGAFYVNFSNSSNGGFYKYETLYVRCVRGGQTAPTYTNHGDGTVTDNSTGLTWQRCSAGQNNDSTCSGSAGAKTWAEALTYCNDLSLGGSAYWRLPDKIELESLTDDSVYNPAINTTYFPNTVANYYWSSTTDASQPDYAWNVYFGDAIAYNFDKHYNPTNVRCVRGGRWVISDAVRIDGTDNYYGTIQPAYDSYGGVKTVLAQGIDLVEDLLFNEGKTITLNGGYDDTFSSITGVTTIHGSLTIIGGDKVTISDIIIR